MKNEIRKQLIESAKVKELTAEQSTDQITDAARLLIETLKTDHKVLFCGNGGSAADAQHFAAELVGRYKMKRKALPAIALTTDTSIITSVGNDFSVGEIFQKQVEGLGRPGDVLVGISTSGSSQNVLHAMDQAKTQGMKIIGLAGAKSCPMLDVADITIQIPSADTPRIQEGHGAVIHILCDLIEQALFGNSSNE